MSNENPKEIVSQVLITKADGTKVPFDHLKLLESLRRAGASDVTAEKIKSHISQELEDGVTTREIYDHAFDLLRKLETRAAIRYSLRRAVLDLGPSGFPFEKFVAEIFKRQGYKVSTDQTVNGFCVEHEVDVVAWKPHSDPSPTKLIMVEAKFHNQEGLKSDLKVMLYVKARMDDLFKAKYAYDGEPYTLDEGWLVTNTKFTISAVKYAKCQNMKAVGWNYPLDGNLHDLIEESGLHPLTCLKTLSEHEKKDLLVRGVVLCKSLEEDQSLLKSLNLPEANMEAVLAEIKAIYASAPEKQP